MQRIMLFVCLLALLIPASLAGAHGEDLEVPCAGLLWVDGFARPTVTQTDAAYGLVVNLGEDDVTFFGGSSEIAEAVEVHEMMMEGDTMIMNPLADGLLIPHLSAVSLAPGGYHVMFIGVTQEVPVGSEVAFTADFGEAGSFDLVVPVKEVAMPGMGDEAEPAATEEAGDMSEEGMKMESTYIGLGACEGVVLEGLTVTLPEVGMEMGEHEDGEEGGHSHGGDDEHGEMKEYIATLEFTFEGEAYKLELPFTSIATTMMMDMDHGN